MADQFKTEYHKCPQLEEHNKKCSTNFEIWHYVEHRTIDTSWIVVDDDYENDKSVDEIAYCPFCGKKLED